MKIFAWVRQFSHPDCHATIQNYGLIGYWDEASTIVPLAQWPAAYIISLQELLGLPLQACYQFNPTGTTSTMEDDIVSLVPVAEKHGTSSGPKMRRSWPPKPASS